MKKRIFISTNYMELGGVERSIIGLLNSIDYSKYEVDFFIHRHTGELMDMIPNKVNVLPEEKNYNTFGTSIKEIVKKGKFTIAFARILSKLSVQIFNKLHNIDENYSSDTYIAKFTSPFLPSLYKYGNYDLAISFLQPHSIVQNKVKANKKIAWIHTDYSFVGLNTALELPIWESFDYIASISNDVTRSFSTRFPSLESKIVLIENILSPEFVREQAREKISDEISKKTISSEIVFCSIGRFVKQKNFINAVRICKHLVDFGINLKWYLIGYGKEEDIIKKEIETLKMEDHFIILGKKANPYPYINECDIYVQPSLYEGKAVTVREAQMLYKPVVITNYPTASSQVEDGVDGIIVSLDPQEASKQILKLLNTKSLTMSIVAYLKNHDYGNEAEIEKIYKLIR